MTPATFTAIRERAGLSQERLACLLRISDSRTVRRWEDGSRSISGPVAILMEMIDGDEFPIEYDEDVAPPPPPAIMNWR